jgi:hypothetical protein
VNDKTNTQTVSEAVKKAKRKFIEDTLLPHAVRRFGTWQNVLANNTLKF